METDHKKQLKELERASIALSKVLNCNTYNSSSMNIERAIDLVREEIRKVESNKVD